MQHRYCIYCYTCIDNRPATYDCCEECTSANRERNNRAEVRRRRAWKKHCDQTSADLGAIAKAATEAGTSYGKYVSKGLDKK